MRLSRTQTVLAACWLGLSLAAACGDSRPAEYRLPGRTMGTTFSVTIVSTSDVDRDRLGKGIDAVLDDVDRQMSTYRPDAELATFNATRTTDWIPVSPRLCQALEQALALGELSDGAFDITVGPLVDLWGFGPGDARFEPPSDDDIENAMQRSGRDKLALDCEQPAVQKRRADMMVDLSGYAKGLAVDRVAALLEENGIADYLVEIGGDLRAHGHNASGEAWRIAIERPDPGGRTVEKIVQLTDAGVATSGDYRNFFEFGGQRYSHTIDPRTGRPVTHELASVTVLADSAATADALATALLVLGPEEGPMLAEREGIAAFFISRRGEGYEPKASSQFSRITQP